MAGTRERGERLQIMLSPEELTALDDFRFKHRMPSRASAIREILRRGLSVLGDPTAKSSRKSSDYGVLGSNAAVTRRRQDRVS